MNKLFNESKKKNFFNTIKKRYDTLFMRIPGLVQFL